MQQQRKRCRRPRGAATVEAVVALPFLLIVLVSILYVRDEYLARQAASVQSRTCAWLYSANGCTRTPPGCPHAKKVRPTTPIDVLLENALADAKDGARDAALSGDLSSIGGVVADAIRGLFTGALANLFKKVAHAEGRARLRKPGLYGGGAYWMLHTTELACNLEPKKQETVLDDVFGKIFP